MKLRLIQAIQKRLRKRNLVITRPGVPANRPLELVKVLADRLPTEEAMTVLQVGANDGIHNDPIRGILMARPRWRGLLVEPQPDVFERLLRNYADHPGVTCTNCAVASKNGHVALYRFRTDAGLPNTISGLASFDKRMLLRRAKKDNQPKHFIERIEVPTRTITTLLAEHDIDHVDLLQIDVEGYDYEVLRFALDEGIQPKVINFESWHLPPPAKEAASDLLAEFGYHHVTVDRDTTAAHESIL